MSVNSKLRPFGASIFGEMTALANQSGAVNLSQGFPDFEGPRDIAESASAAILSGENQYAPSRGHTALRDAIAAHQKRFYDLDVCAEREVVVTSGCTEAIASALLGLLEEGDEVVLFEPFYDSYPATIAMAGGVAKYCTLRFPDFALDEDRLRACMSKNTRAIVVNSPHNPSGHVFTDAEQACIARLAKEFDAIIISDEVYEHLTYDGVKHRPMACVDGALERTLTLSSTGKTYSYTGWKVGWAIGPAPLVEAVQAAHQFLTFSGARPLQVAMAHALNEHHAPFVESLQSEYRKRRDFLCDALSTLGFDVVVPEGTYFALARFDKLSDKSDIEFAKELCRDAKVACIPPSGFYANDIAEGQGLLRFAFCKKQETLERAVSRLETWRNNKR